MVKEELLLYNLIKNEEINDFKNRKISVSNVELVRKEMKLIINLASKDLINEKDFEKLSSIFQNLFRKFTILLNIKYIVSGDNKSKFDFYKENMLEYIKNNILSSLSWINNVDFDISSESLTIFAPNQVAYHSLSNGVFIDNLENKFSNELDLNIDIQVCNSRFKIEKDFLNLKTNEEKTIAKSILKEINSNTSSSHKKYYYGKRIKGQDIKIDEINLETGNCIIEGEVFDLETRDIRNNKTLVIFNISDKSNSITAKCFLSKEDTPKFLSNVKDESYVKLQGSIMYDNYSRSIVMMLNSLELMNKEIRQDKAEEKRIELHLHTKMSSMDAVSDLRNIVERAKMWGHEALAITDHGTVQSFPYAMELSKEFDMKIIYGLEGYLINDKKNIIKNFCDENEESSYIVFDLETTGLSSINDKITEIGAVKITNNEIVDSYSQLVNPERPISEFITKLTGITDEMVKDMPTIDEVMIDFRNFIKDDILVAHNAQFDIGFIRQNMKNFNIELTNPVLDTLELARAVFPDLKNHKLNTLAKHLTVKLDNHHRALDDAKATAEIFLKILDLLEEQNVCSLDEINNFSTNKSLSKDRPFHVILLVKNLVGLKNLYRIVSESHMNHFYKNPRIPKTLLEKYREGLIIGSACEAGELYKSILNNNSTNEIKNIVDFYDFLEIQPIENNMFLINNGYLKDVNQLKEINQRIYKLGKENNKPVVATGDVHFLDPDDEIYRRILMSGQNFSDADSQPPLYFKTTDEMLEEFSYLGQEESKEVVVENPNIINSMIERISPIPEGTFPPVIEGSEEELEELTYKKAYEIYGKPLPQIVEDRLSMELNAIIKNGYAVMYIISQKLVWKSIEDGYLVGSRGSVGSSFVATMSGITEINPLSPHYVCHKCKYSEFFNDGSIASGADLEDKICPNCENELTKDGHDIPFEVFLGFDGDKEPDIDLNFASEYQSEAHRYTEELFGQGYVFRAGTIGTIADKTAYGFVKKYYDAKEKSVNSAEINRLVKGCTGIRRTSGQHPGGVMIVPKDKEILDFTPIQYPANDKTSGVITTHFDYNAISSQILKLDILGHDVPTIIRMLEDMTGVEATKIPLDEPKTMKLFTSTESMNITKEDINCQVGTLGIPEFGTKFVRQMLVDTQPSTFSELVRISGLSHGTDVWINNAQNLVKNDIAPLSKVISTREDIMLFLINAGGDKKWAFHVMEKVRKGKGLTSEDERIMRSLKVPEWYIDSCKKIKYMFPKAHAAAYVMMSFRIAYFKVYYPEAFYATYFTIKARDFDADLVLKGIDVVRSKIKELEKNFNDTTTKEKNQLTVLEVVLEMYSRGLKFHKVDLYKSHSDNFVIVDNAILPPLKSLEGLGENVARKIMEEREISEFISIEDLVKRGGVNKSVLEVLKNHGCLESLPVSNQINLFNI